MKKDPTVPDPGKPFDDNPPDEQEPISEEELNIIGADLSDFPIEDAE